MSNPEERRLEENSSHEAYWQRWGPYLSERAWGTVREDYSPHGTAWEYFPHDHARSRAYRWNEDGIAGISDRHQHICFALTLWNGNDAILKERLFGLTGNEGNHGEDVKECYFYVDNTPTHSYMKYLYKYPQQAFPYSELKDVNQRRSREEPEYELTDTGIFDGNRYFDVTVEYAKASPEDILVRITAVNRGAGEAALHLLPTIWFRNRWSWGRAKSKPALRPACCTSPEVNGFELDEERYGRRWLLGEGPADLLLCENETNLERLYGVPNASSTAKDGFAGLLVEGRQDAVRRDGEGTKGALHYRWNLAAGETRTVCLRFGPKREDLIFGREFDSVFETRIREADEFYSGIVPSELTQETRNVMRQALAGMLWSKQYYHYVVKEWLEGDPGLPTPPASRCRGRNSDWPHIFNADVISMPDKWEYPWYAAWDLAFHCVALAVVDSEFAKQQLVLLLREWYLHPNGQIPAYEWAFHDVNPPVHAWAAWRVYKIEKKRRGTGDRVFLEKIFHKLLLNFTWWVNRKDAGGKNVFEGGFLGLDNIGVFDRSKPLPTGGHIEQADATGWMAMYSLNLLAIAMELAEQDSAYEDVASKFWEHFLFIANAMNHLGPERQGLWDEHDGFFYDILQLTGDGQIPMKVRSMVGLIPLFAVETLEPWMMDKLAGFKRRLEWFIENRPDLTANVASMNVPGEGRRRLLSIVNPAQLRRILARMLDENEFLSPFGIRALSRVYRDQPYVLSCGGEGYQVRYEPAESSTGLFGGNSNWRGPVWFPVNFLLIESIQKFHHYLGDDFRVECPTGSGRECTLWEVAAEISSRLGRVFLTGADGHRPVNGRNPIYQDEHWRDLVLFYEYFHGDNGAGIGASHQTGWTGLIAKLLQQSGEPGPV